MTLLDLHTATSLDDTSRDTSQDAGWLIEPSMEPSVEAAGERVGSSYARCADGNGTLTHLFFSDDEFDIARAKAICGRCGLAPECLGGALDRAEPYGVWGGELLVDGVIVSVKRGRGRPPKTPRAPLVVDEVPIPPHPIPPHLVA